MAHSALQVIENETRRIDLLWCGDNAVYEPDDPILTTTDSTSPTIFDIS
jgi:hypothetical protein